MDSDATDHSDDSTATFPTPSLSRRTFVAGSTATLLAGATGLGSAQRAVNSRGEDGEDTTTFSVRLENVSTGQTLTTSADDEAMEQPVPLAPGAYAVHTEPGPIFTADERAPNNGLEALAEDGKPMALARTLTMTDHVSRSGAFATPAGADEPGPLLPGHAYEFSFEATPGDRLSFATMFVPSNDLFYAPDDRGIALFDGETPLSGDVTMSVGLWDAGTEHNEEPGVGPNQPQRQSGADTGEAGYRPIRLVSEVADGHSYPAVSDVLTVTLSPQ